jgi:tetratricopeptide (TPR) repeat protein
MDADGWYFGNAFASVVRAAALIGDETTLRRLKEQAVRTTKKSTQFKCRSALAAAFAVRRSLGEARSLLAAALEAVLAAGPGDYDVREQLGTIADSFVLLKDESSLHLLLDFVLGADKHLQPRLLQELLPALAKAGKKAVIETALASFTWAQSAQRSRVLSAGAAALLKLGDASAAFAAAGEALEAFLQERDGAVTPDVLPQLIPVLVATNHGAGLVRLSEMGAAKWPYRREWGPGVRLLLPALAALGLDDVRPRPYEVFKSEQSFVDPAQADLAEVYAKRGLLDKAIAAADTARSPKSRAEGHLRIARVMADSGDFSGAERRLAAALSRFPAIRGDAVLIAEMALLATRIGASHRVCWTLKQTFLRSTDIDVVNIDINLYRNAARAAAQIGDASLMQRVVTTASVRFKDIVHRAAQDTGDVTQRAGPLFDLARALSMGGRSTEAKQFMIQALDCARHAGRQVFLDMLCQAAPILLVDASAADLGKVIIDVAGFWD